MKISLIFYGCIILFSSLEQGFSLEVGEERRLEIPLIDLGVLWAEKYLNPRKKRSTNPKVKQGIIDKLFQGKDDKGDVDVFVDSLVGTISKIDPNMLVRLKERIKKFEEKQPGVVHHPRSSDLYHGSDRRPLIQFFNVTRISVGVPEEDEDEDAWKKVNEEENSLKEFYGQKAEETGHRVPKRENPPENNHGTKVSQAFTDNLAKIKESLDKSKYNSEIEIITAKNPVIGNLMNINGMLQKMVKLRKKKDVDNKWAMTSETPSDVLKLNEMIGRSNNVSNVYRFYSTSMPRKHSIIL